MPQILTEGLCDGINRALHFLVISASCSRTAGDAAPLVPSGQLLVHEGSDGGRQPHLSVSPEGIPGVFSLRHIAIPVNGPIPEPVKS